MQASVAKQVITLLRLALGFGVLYYLVSSGSLSWSLFTRLAEEWHYTLLAITLFLGATVTHAYRLHALINAGQLELSTLSAIKLTFIGLFFNTYLPGSTGGDIVKIYYASKGNPGRRTEVVTTLLLDRLIGLFALFAFPILLAPFFIPLIQAYSPIKILLLSTIGVTTVILIGFFISINLDIANSSAGKWIAEKIKFGDLAIRAVNVVYSYRLNMPAIIKAVILSWVHQLLMVGVALAIAQAISLQGAKLEMVALIPFGYLANALPITPGGLGIGEAAMESIFNLCGLQGGAEILLGWRTMMILVGLLGLLFFIKGEKRFIFSNLPQEKIEK